jgi:hypothetical protein
MKGHDIKQVEEGEGEGGGGGEEGSDTRRKTSKRT